MRKFKIFYREYMNSCNCGMLVVIADNIVEAIKQYEKKNTIHVVYKIEEF